MFTFLAIPLCINGIKNKGMRTKYKGNVLVEQNNYAMCSMANIPLIPKYKVVLKKGKCNRIRVFYNICMDPNLGIGWVAVCCVACGCGPCKAQLKMAWMPQVDNCAQPCYAENKECLLWPSYEGMNDW